MTLTQNGVSTSLEFELPEYMTDKIVTSVDVANNKITVTDSGKTGEAGDITNGDPDTFSLAGKYDGNLGTLIGRTVNFQYDTDQNLTAFTLDDADVVYGAMQYVNDGTAPKDGYYKDKITGTKYKNSATASSTKNITAVFNAYDGDYLGIEADAGTTYQYVKLVLNPDGTVSTAFILETLDINLFVTEIDGTKAIQDNNNGVDLDGYIIVKDDQYVKPADLELGDVVFVNATRKFADVYNNEISGEIDNVISGKLDIDGKTYTWTGAQYYDEGDDEYKTLNTGDDDEKSQNYLNSLDTTVDTTIWLNRKGDIVYIDGTETGVVQTTDVTYLIEAAAKGYTESLKNIIQLKVFNGDETETLAIKIDDLKYFNGVAGTYAAGANGDAWTGDADDDLDFTGKTDDSEDLDDVDLDDLFPAGELMVVTYDAAGKAIGLKAHESTALTIDGTAGAGTLDNTNPLGAANSPNLSKDTKVVTTVKNAATDHKWSTGSYTNLWIWNEKGTAGDLSDDAFSKVALTDFDNEIITTEHVTLESVAYRASGTKAVDLVVKIGGNGAYKAADTNTINGMLTGTTKKNNSDNTAQVINTITIIGTDGAKATYQGDGTLAAVTDAKNGDYVTLTQNKTTEKITAAVKTADWQYANPEDAPIGYLLATRDYDSQKLVLDDDTQLTVAEGGAILLRYTEEGSVKHKVVTYSDVNTIKNQMKVWYNNTYLDSTGTKIQSDMIVVEECSAAEILVLGVAAIAAADAAADVGPDTVAEYAALVDAIAEADALVASAETVGLTVGPDADDYDLDTTDLVTAKAVLAGLDSDIADAKTLFADADYSAASTDDTPIAAVTTLATLKDRIVGEEDGIVDNASDAVVSVVAPDEATAIGATEIGLTATFLDGSTKTVTITTAALTAAIAADTEVYPGA